ncbi:MAG: DUF4827 domain-containing protein [Tannerella sp.]|jgi:hypothetical protein|nr:DUF4827 domain-containing protein [Tannerella sp.]
MIAGAIFTSSCSKKPKSYAEMKRDEKRAIDKLIATEGFEILTKYPANGVFGEKQFVLLDNGVYLNVVDSGNGNRPVLGKTTILMRCSGKFLFEADSINSFSNFSNSDDPIEFMYGYTSNIISQLDAGTIPWALLSTGVESSLNYVGENSVVKLIVPFEQGSNYQNYSGMILYGSPFYYDKIRFTFY